LDNRGSSRQPTCDDWLYGQVGAFLLSTHIEKRLTILEVLADQNQKSLDRLDRSIADLRSDMNCRFTEVDRKFTEVDRKFTDVDRKFTWLIGMQSTTFIAIIGIFAKLLNIF
jgi:hypothetical protein